MKVESMAKPCVANACQCFQKVTDGRMAKLLAIFRNISPSRPERYVEVLKKLGGKDEMDKAWNGLSMIDRVQVRQCAQNWVESARLANAGKVLQVAIRHADAKTSEEKESAIRYAKRLFSASEVVPTSSAEILGLEKVIAVPVVPKEMLAR